GKHERRGRDSNPRNREAAQRFSRPPPSTTRTPLPSTKNAHAAVSTWQRAAAHHFTLSSRFHYTYRPELCQQNWPLAPFARFTCNLSPRIEARKRQAGARVRESALAIPGSGGFSPGHPTKSRRSGSCPWWRSLSPRLSFRAFL